MPSSFPKEHWHKEVRQGYEFYLTSLRSDLVRPVEFDAINFYQHAAPEVLSIRRAVDRVESPTAVHFERMDLPLNTNSIDPAIAQVFYDTSCDELFTTDMRSGRFTGGISKSNRGLHRSLQKQIIPVVLPRSSGITIRRQIISLPIWDHFCRKITAWGRCCFWNQIQTALTYECLSTHVRELWKCSRATLTKTVRGIFS